jgi:hypothetical protein
VRTEIAFPTHSAFEKILLHEHPGFLPIFTFGPPGIFAGDPREADMKAHFDYVEIYADNAKRSQAHSHKPIVIARNLRLKTYARLLAKIGHAYAVAELGMTGFKPYLNDLILGKPPLYPGFYIGGLPSQSPPYGRIPPPGKDVTKLVSSPPTIKRRQVAGGSQRNTSPFVFGFLATLAGQSIMPSPVNYCLCGAVKEGVTNSLALHLGPSIIINDVTD